jgi:hypothetical protein
MSNPRDINAEHSFQQPGYNNDNYEDPDMTGADVSKSMLNITAITNQNFMGGSDRRQGNLPHFDKPKENLLGTQKLNKKD